MKQLSDLNFNYLFLSFLLSIFVFNSCQKDVVGDDMEQRTDGISVFDINANRVFGMQEIPGVGYTVLYSGSENFTFTKVGSAVISKYGQLLSSNLYGGSYNDYISGYTNDEEGNTYVVGESYSPELRLNTLPSPYGPSSDAYLAKLDKSGNLIWQIGYSDTATGNFGSLHEIFGRVEVIDDSIYCYGVTQNYKNLGQPNPNDLLSDNWLVIFDQNGQFGSKRIIPNLVKSTAFGPASATNTMIKCGNNDIIMVQNLDRTYGPVPAAYDTTCIITRYNPSTGAIVWTIYGDKESPEGDINQLVELANGELFCLNSLRTKAIKISGSSGNVISTNDLDILEGFSGGDVFIRTKLKRAGDNLYLVGSISNGLELSIGIGLTSSAVQKGSKPWLVKMDLEGNVSYSKFYEVAESGFVDILQKQDGNLQLLGEVSKYGTLEYSGFFLTVDSDGQIVTNN